MRNVKKVGVLVLSILLIASMLLTACGNKSVEGNTETTQKVQAPQKEKLEPVTLKMVVPGTPQTDQALVSDAISKYIKDDLNLTLDLQQIDWSSWADKNNLIIASGEECDVIFSAPWCGYITNSAKGAFLDVDSLMQQYGQDILKSEYSWIVDAARVDGILYAVPTYQMLAQSRGFFLRKDLVEKYGPEINFKINEVNNTFQDLEPMLKIIKEKEPDMIPLYMIPGKMPSFMGMWDRDGQYDAAGIDGTKEVLLVENFFEADFFKQSMDIARRWFLAGYINKDVATTKEDAGSIFKAGKTFGFSGQTNVGEDESIGKKLGKPIVMYPIMKPFLTTGLVQGAMFAIPRQSTNPERAMMFINRMHTDKKLVNMLVYGIEDKHYVKKSENVIDTAPGIDPTKNTYYNMSWMFGNQSLAYVYADGNPEASRLLDEFNQNAVRSPALGFTYNADKMKNEIAAISNVAAEFEPSLSSGAVDPNKDGLYDKFLSKLKAAGVDKLIADKQSQLDAWLKLSKK